MTGFAGHGCIPARPQIWAAAESSRDRWVQLLAHRVFDMNYTKLSEHLPREHRSHNLAAMKQLDMHRY